MYIGIEFSLLEILWKFLTVTFHNIPIDIRHNLYDNVYCPVAVVSNQDWLPPKRFTATLCPVVRFTFLRKETLRWQSMKLETDELKLVAAQSSRWERAFQL